MKHADCLLLAGPRAVMVQLGFFFHMKLALGAPSLALTRPLLFAMAFMLVFSITIALFKDIPDVKGDAQEGVRTFSVRMGVKNVFWTCIALVEVAYAGAIGVGLMSEVCRPPASPSSDLLRTMSQQDPADVISNV